MSGVADKKHHRELRKGYLFVGQIEHNGPWVAEGAVDSICWGQACFVVKWQKLYGQKRSSRTKHMSLTLEHAGSTAGQGIKFAVDDAPCQDYSL